MKKAFFLPAWMFSLLCAFVAAKVFGAIKLFSTMDYILWAGGFMFVILLFGFMGMKLAFRLSKKYKLELNKGWFMRLLACAIVVAMVGAGGQALFMIGREKVTINATVDMVLLLDASGSMDSYGYNTARTDAATQFVDSLDDTSRLQVVAFAGTVVGKTQLMTMDASGKQTATQFITDIDSVGSTNFNGPLRQAVETLKNQARPDSNKAIILLTDGEGDLENSVVSQILNEQVMVFSVRIDPSSSVVGQVKDLVNLAQKSGGFDTRLAPQADGSVDTTALLDAFKDAFKASTEERTEMKSELLICSENTTVYQFIVRLLTLVLCAVVFGFAYYGWCGKGKLLMNAGCGVALTVLVTILGGMTGACLFLACLMLAAAYATLEMDGGDMLDV